MKISSQSHVPSSPKIVKKFYFAIFDGISQNFTKKSKFSNSDRAALKCKNGA